MIWVDASSGASGDMLLAALHDLGVPAQVMSDAAAAVAPVEISFEREVRHGFAVGRAHVRGVEADVPHRTWADVRELLDRAALADQVRDTAHRAFARLADAEGRVHGTSADDVHFHEVGAHDAIGDVVGVCAGFAWLGDPVRVGPIALGAGTARSAHGEIPVPVPAVLHLLTAAGAPAHGGPVDLELCTPTGAALLTTLADSYGQMPTMTVEQIGAGAGSRVLLGRLGALRLVRGTSTEDAGTTSELERSTAVVLETNVDDLDPRVWPHVLSRLMEEGASDAWLTPILMKKGRPAHTLHVLCPDDAPARERLARVVFSETSAIGLRTVPVTKTALSRSETTVDVEGHPVRVKLAVLDAVVVNAQPEHDDVLAAAQASGRTMKSVLAQASAAATAQLGRSWHP
jgi:uncharacterized protein (TIGR00299 family) protein